MEVVKYFIDITRTRPI